MAVDPSNPTARFFLALGKAQTGDVEGALNDWMALEKDTPKDAPWRATLEEHIAKAAIRHDFWVLSDEIYSRLVYGEPAPSIANLPGMAERTVICDGFSKTYAMTGWRLGFGIMPKELADNVQLLLTHSVGCTSHFIQVAGIEALTGPQEPVDSVVAEYQHRRNTIVDGLNAIPGVTCQRPQGACPLAASGAGPDISSSRSPRPGRS